MKFSKRFTLPEIEERWWLLLYDEETSKGSKRRSEALSRERIRAIQSKIPFSADEEQLVKAVSSAINPTGQCFEQLLEQHRQVFHHARTPKVVEEYWRELKYYGLLADQRPLAMDDELLQVVGHVYLYILYWSANLRNSDREPIRHVRAQWNCRKSAVGCGGASPQSKCSKHRTRNTRVGAGAS